MALETARVAALNQTTDVAQAGIVFDDATRLLDGGLWKASADPNPGDGQTPYLGMYTTDLHAVLNDITADLAAPGTVTVNGTAYTLTATDVTTLTQIEGQLGTLISEAPQSVGFGANAIAAQNALHQGQLAIMSEIQADTGLATVLNGATVVGGTGFAESGFQALPTGSDSAAALAAATAPGASLQTIGLVFNAANSLAEGGLNGSNLHQFDTDMQAIETGVNNIINDPAALAALGKGDPATTIHLETVAEQIELQMTDFDAQVANHVQSAARATNDNMLDIIDIVQGDANLATAAGGPTGGFGEVPSTLAGSVTHYQDNQAQTNFWSEFIAGANQINNGLTAIAAGQATEVDGTPTPTAAALETIITNYEAMAQHFSSTQGGIFGARFDNELKGGTLEVDSTNAIAALQVLGNQGGATAAEIAAAKAEAIAAGAGFVADAGDVSGNNNPYGGGTYVGTSTTVAGATSVNGIATTTSISQNPTTLATDTSTVKSAYVVGQQTPISAGSSGGHHGHDDLFPIISMGGQNGQGSSHYDPGSSHGGSDHHDYGSFVQMASNQHSHGASDWMFHHH